MAQALALARRFNELECHKRSSAQFNDLLPFSCIHLDATGSVVEMNRRAHAMLAEGDGLELASGKLRATRAASDNVFQQRLRDLLSSGPRPRVSFARLVRRSGRGIYLAFMNAVPSESTAAVRVPSVRLLVIDTNKCNYMPRQVLQALFDLTEAESLVALHLSQGDTIEEAANRLGIAYNTARHHVERIFKKTGTHRQSDLMRFTLAPFLAIPSMLAED